MNIMKSRSCNVLGSYDVLGYYEIRYSCVLSYVLNITET